MKERYENIGTSFICNDNVTEKQAKEFIDETLAKMFSLGIKVIFLKLPTDFRL